jgi:hypothetical protein
MFLLFMAILGAGLAYAFDFTFLGWLGFCAVIAGAWYGFQFLAGMLVIRAARARELN